MVEAAAENLIAAKNTEEKAILAHGEVMGGYDPTPLIDPYRVAWETPRSEITSLTIPERVYEIGSGAFYGCTNEAFNELVIPSHVYTIGNEAFGECTFLKKLTLEDGGSSSIGSNAFYNCVSLEELHIPWSMYYIAPSAFFGIPQTCNVQIEMTIEEVRDGYGAQMFLDAGFPTGIVFHCTDGDYTLE